jgi:hypothetical protein
MPPDIFDRVLIICKDLFQTPDPSHPCVASSCAEVISSFIKSHPDWSSWSPADLQAVRTRQSKHLCNFNQNVQLELKRQFPTPLTDPTVTPITMEELSELLEKIDLPKLALAWMGTRKSSRKPLAVEHVQTSLYRVLSFSRPALTKNDKNEIFKLRFHRTHVLPVDKTPTQQLLELLQSSVFVRAIRDRLSSM